MYIECIKVFFYSKTLWLSALRKAYIFLNGSQIIRLTNVCNKKNNYINATDNFYVYLIC